MAAVTVSTAADLIAATGPALRAGDTILLAPGTYPTNINLNKPGVTLRMPDGAPTGSAIIQYTGAHDYSEALKVSAPAVTVRDVAVKGIGCRDVSVASVAGVSLINVHSVGDYYGFDFDSVDKLLLQGCTAKRKASYVYFCHGNQSSGTRSGKVTVIGCQGGGSDGQHNFRCNSVDDISFDACDFAFAADSSNGKFSAGITVRAGVGKVTINNCDIYGLWIGPKIGPGADHEGDTVGSATVTNCRIKGGYLALYRGLGSFLIADCTVAADRSGSAVSVDDGLTGELARLTLTYPNGKAFNRELTAMPPGVKLTGPTTFGGAVIVKAPAPTPPPVVVTPTVAEIVGQLKALPLPPAAVPLIDQLAARAK
jgi:hypothetical protein